MAASLILVDFRGDTLLAAQCDDGVFVAIKPISDSFGLKWSGQHDRVTRDPILSESIRIIRIPSPVGVTQETVCLPLDMVHGWLFGIDIGRIKGKDDQETEEKREKVKAYKRQCFRVLFEHFHGKAQATAEELAEMRISDDAKVRQVTETRLTFGHAAAARLWIKLGLPVVPEMLRDPRIGDLFDETTLTMGGMQ